MSARCEAMTQYKQWLYVDPLPAQCRLVEGHDGDHEAYVCPFPGFADERITWGEPGVERVGFLGELEKALEAGPKPEIDEWTHARARQLLWGIE